MIQILDVWIDIFTTPLKQQLNQKYQGLLPKILTIEFDHPENTVDGFLNASVYEYDEHVKRGFRWLVANQYNTNRISYENAVKAGYDYICTNIMEFAVEYIVLKGSGRPVPIPFNNAVTLRQQANMITSNNMHNLYKTLISLSPENLENMAAQLTGLRNIIEKIVNPVYIEKLYYSEVREYCSKTTKNTLAFLGWHFMASIGIYTLFERGAIGIILILSVIAIYVQFHNKQIKDTWLLHPFFCRKIKKSIGNFVGFLKRFRHWR